ncbi:MAG TPA: helix-turn-helix transcriptional regulator [Bradyrhizobium sp.]|jgi:transcriptional regulator with XRE-family HTH domain|nr:helix-turn-helix transcriptional regulator [Bradyrhizobium sp.]
MSVAVKPISKRELLAYQADVKGSIFRQIREVLARFKERGFTQKELADKIGMDPGQLSRRLRGDYDLQLETLSDLARGLDCRIDVKLTSINQVLNANDAKLVKAMEDAPGDNRSQPPRLGTPRPPQKDLNDDPYRRQLAE